MVALGLICAVTLLMMLSVPGVRKLEAKELILLN